MGMNAQIEPAATPADSIAEAEDLRRRGCHGDAIAMLQAILAARPNEHRAQHALALTYRLRAGPGDYERALQCWDSILADRPANLRILQHRIDMAAKFGRTADLARFIDEARTRAPDHPAFAFRKAAMLRAEGHTAQAVALLEPLAAGHPDDGNMQLELAAALHADRRHAEAVAILDTLPDKDAARPVELRVNALAASGRASEALVVAERFLAQEPGHFGLRLRRAQMLRLLGHASESAALLVALDDERPDNATVLAHLLAAQLAAEDHAACLATVARLLGQQQWHRGALLARNDALHRMGDGAGLERVLRDLAGQLGTATDAGSRNILAGVICHSLNRVPDLVARDILRTCRDVFLDPASSLSPHDLWGLYRRADLLGQGADYAGLVPRIMQADDLPFATVRSILHDGHAAGLPNWREVAHHLHARTCEGDRPLVSGLIAMLEGEPHHGLAQRDRRPDAYRPTRALQLAALLRQAGRIRVAARYMGVVWRRHDDHPAVLKEYIACLAGSGQMRRAAQVLEAASHRATASAWRRTIAQGWAEIDHLDRALVLAGDTAAGHGDMPTWQVAMTLSRADRAELPGLARQLSDRATHLMPSMTGALLTEALRCEDRDLPPHELTIDAIRYLAGFMNAPEPTMTAAPGTAPIPRTVLQYWSQGQPPAQLQPALDSWRCAPGWAHHLLDRADAQRFLHREWGQDWVRAFNRAGSATEESDFLRLCHLALHGGVYADCDDWLIGNPEDLRDEAGRLTLYREPTGALGNNIIAAPPRHPAIVWAAFSARRALLEAHGDNVWNRSGPGLLTRAVTWHLEVARKAGADPALRLLPRWQLGKVVQYHSPQPYKFGAGYWNRRNTAGGLSALSRFGT